MDLEDYLEPDYEYELQLQQRRQMLFRDDVYLVRGRMKWTMSLTTRGSKTQRNARADSTSGSRSSRQSDSSS